MYSQQIDIPGDVICFLNQIVWGSLSCYNYNPTITKK
jgi:hypothetical protein